MPMINTFKCIRCGGKKVIAGAPCSMCAEKGKGRATSYRWTPRKVSSKGRVKPQHLPEMPSDWDYSAKHPGDSDYGSDRY